ncbi:MAG: hypothetical protein ACRCSF_06515 [Mycobacteriaceae bacterium]
MEHENTLRRIRIWLSLLIFLIVITSRFAQLPAEPSLTAHTAVTVTAFFFSLGVAGISLALALKTRNGRVLSIFLTLTATLSNALQVLKLYSAAAGHYELNHFNIILAAIYALDLLLWLITLLLLFATKNNHNRPVLPPSPVDKQSP